MQVSIDIPVNSDIITKALPSQYQVPLTEPLEIVLNGRVVPNTPSNRKKLQKMLACATK